MDTCSAKTWISNGPMEIEGYVTPVWVLGCRAAVPQCAEAECSYTGHGGEPQCTGLTRHQRQHAGLAGAMKQWRGAPSIVPRTQSCSELRCTSEQLRGTLGWHWAPRDRCIEEHQGGLPKLH